MSKYYYIFNIISTFLTIDNVFFRLDGLKSGPILIGEVVTDHWLDIANPAVQQRIQRYEQTETHFALLSVRPKKLDLLQARLTALQSTMETTENNSEVQQTEIAIIEQEIRDEIEIEEKQRQENLRRRHNYVPLIVKLLQHLANKNLLSNMIEEGKTLQQQQYQAAAAKKKQNKTL
jgi:ubiquitin carboxyl-terminal hydrolase L5